MFLVKTKNSLHVTTDIDVYIPIYFDKMSWVNPLKENTCENVLSCFKEILNQCGEKPQHLNTDIWSKFICKNFFENDNQFKYIIYIFNDNYGVFCHQFNCHD